MATTVGRKGQEDIQYDKADDSQWIVWPNAREEASWANHELVFDWAAALELTTQRS
jgi:hypothetical protein